MIAEEKKFGQKMATKGEFDEETVQYQNILNAFGASDISDAESIGTGVDGLKFSSEVQDAISKVADGVDPMYEADFDVDAWINQKFVLIIQI